MSTEEAQTELQNGEPILASHGGMATSCRICAPVLGSADVVDCIVAVTWETSDAALLEDARAALVAEACCSDVFART